jgi:hypothetical protein
MEVNSGLMAGANSSGQGSVRRPRPALHRGPATAARSSAPRNPAFVPRPALHRGPATAARSSAPRNPAFAPRSRGGGAFCAESILRNTQQLGISLNDLKGLGTQLDAAGVGYKPYELYRGTGSDHGIDFDDLIAGGLGTAYDWTQDANVAAKGPGAIRRLEEAAALAQSLQLVAHAEVTQNKGIDPTRFATQAATGESPRHYVMFNGSVAAWYGSSEQAEQARHLYGGGVTDLALRASSTAVGMNAHNPGSGTSPVNSDGVTQATTSSSAVSWNDQLQALIDAIHERLHPPTPIR